MALAMTGITIPPTVATVPATTTLLIAPALTVVFLMRYSQAGRFAEHLPRMPKAKLLPRRATAALLAPSAGEKTPGAQG